MTFVHKLLVHELRHLWMRSPSLHMWRILSGAILFSLTLALETFTLSSEQKSVYIYTLLYVCFLMYAIMAHPSASERNHQNIMSIYLYTRRISVYLVAILAHWIFLGIHSILMWLLAAHAMGLSGEHNATYLFIVLTSLNFVIFRQLLSVIIERKTQFLVGFLILPLTLPMLLFAISLYTKSATNPSVAIGASMGICLISLGISLLIYEFISRKS